MLHELSHMWFGDSVAPYEWSDIWLNEGHASWYEFVYAEEQGFLAEDTADYPDEQGYATLDELMRAVYAHSDQWRHDSGPVAHAEQRRRDDLFSLQRLPRRRARPVRAAPEGRRRARSSGSSGPGSQRYATASASTDDFIALAVAGVRTAT